MNNAIFASMREQLRPSQKARDALENRLMAARRHALPVRRYAAVAACAVAIAAAVPVGIAVRNHWKWRLIEDSFQTGCRVRPENPHSYVLAEDSAACWPEDAVTAADGAGDRDQNMTPGEVADNMLEAGFSQADVDTYLASGWQLTWANWWKFYHLSEESGDRSLDALLDFSAEAGLAVNTGVETAPSGDYPDTPGQDKAVSAYQNLMARFEADYGPDAYPEWYGGAFIDRHAGLTVNIVEGLEPEGKELYLQIQNWAGSDRIGFASCKLSLNQLRGLQDKIMTAMEESGIQAGCGVNEETNQVELDLPFVNDDALWKLAELDPAGTAILVRAGYYATDGAISSIQ